VLFVVPEIKRNRLDVDSKREVLLETPGKVNFALSCTGELARTWLRSLHIEGITWSFEVTLALKYERHKLDRVLTQ
jgi:hypothetical protein